VADERGQQVVRGAAARVGQHPHEGAFQKLRLTPDGGARTAEGHAVRPDAQEGHRRRPRAADLPGEGPSAAPELALLQLFRAGGGARAEVRDPEAARHELPLLERREEPFGEARLVQGLPEAVAGPREVTADGPGIQARVDPAEQHAQPGRDHVRHGPVRCGREIGGRGPAYTPARDLQRRPTMGRRVLAAVAGGVVVFVWSALSHIALGLGTAGIRSIPNEERVAQAIRGVITEPGLYFFPGFDTSHKMTAEEQKAWTEKYRRGPSGILVVQPGGREPMTPVELVIELVADILAAGVAVFVLGAMGGSFLARVMAVGLLGVFEWLDINVSYWNWYKFPSTFTVAALIEQLVGWTLAGLVMALMLRGRSGPAAQR